MTDLILTASQQTALEALDGRIQAIEQSAAQQLQPLYARRAAVLAELGLPPDATYTRDGDHLTVTEAN